MCRGWGSDCGGGTRGNPQLRLPCLINLHLAHSGFQLLSRHTTVAFCRPTSAPVRVPPHPSTLPALRWLLTGLTGSWSCSPVPALSLHKPTAKCCFCRSIYVDCNFQLSFKTHTYICTSVFVCDFTFSSHCSIVVIIIDLSPHPPNANELFS